MPPDRQTGRRFPFYFFKEDFFHENPFPTPAQHGTGAEYAADLPARFGFRRKYPPSYAVSNADPQPLDPDNTYTDGNNTYTYELNTTNNTATLTKFTGTDAYVPKTVTKGTETYKVTTIGEGAFATLNHNGAYVFNATLESVFLPDSIQTIEHGAFHGCSSLHKIILWEGLTTIGNGAFAMAGLTEVTLPKSLKEVGDSAFTSIFYDGTHYGIQTVTYTGTLDQWEALTKSNDFADYNDQLLEAPHFIFAAYSITPATPTTPPQQPGTTTPTTPPESTDKPTDKPNEPTTPEQPGTQEKPNEPTPPEQPGTPEKPNEPTPPEAPAVEEDDTASIGYAAAAVTAAFVGWGAYRIGSEVYLKYLLPKDVLLPQNRIQLAKLLWEDAGRPAPADDAPYTDVDANDADAQQAARWAVENGLLTLPDTEKPEEFAPYRSVSYAKSARAWNQAQQLKENAAAR